MHHHPRHLAKPSTAQRIRGAALLLALLALSAVAAIYGPDLHPGLRTQFIGLTGGNAVALWLTGWALVVLPLTSAVVLLFLAVRVLRRAATVTLAVTLPLLILLGKPRGEGAQQWRDSPELAPFSAAVEATSLAVLLLAALAAIIFVIRLALTGKGGLDSVAVPVQHVEHLLDRGEPGK